MSFNDEIESKLEEVLALEKYEEAEGIVEAFSDKYNGDLAEMAFRIALQQNCYDYVERHIEEIDLNDSYGCSTYLGETDDERIIDFLNSHGANRNLEEFEGCQFAAETVNGEIISFSKEFQREVLGKALSVLKISEEQLIHMLDSGEAEGLNLGDDISVLDLDNLAELCDALRVSVDKGKLRLGEFKFFDGSSDAVALIQLIESLGWKLRFEGSTVLGSIKEGVYYIW